MPLKMADNYGGLQKPSELQRAHALQASGLKLRDRTIDLGWFEINKNIRRNKSSHQAQQLGIESLAGCSCSLLLTDEVVRKSGCRN
jgi:hypothetical protein